jgi:hypothetical protein
MAALFAVLLETGYCGCDAYDYLICSKAALETEAHTMAEENALQYDSGEEDEMEYLENVGFNAKLLVEHYEGTLETAREEFGCPSLHFE